MAIEYVKFNKSIGKAGLMSNVRGVGDQGSIYTFMPEHTVVHPVTFDPKLRFLNEDTNEFLSLGPEEAEDSLIRVDKLSEKELLVLKMGGTI